MGKGKEALGGLGVARRYRLEPPELVHRTRDPVARSVRVAIKRGGLRPDRLGRDHRQDPLASASVWVEV